MSLFIIITEFVICSLIFLNHTGHAVCNTKVNVNMSSTTPDIMDLLDRSPAFGSYLSGIYKRSFAYKTLKDRCPVIITQIIDRISRNKDKIIEKYGQDSVEELKHVIGILSELRSDLMTNKVLQALNFSESGRNNDITRWNEVIENQSIMKKHPSTWYSTIWLLSECYMYRRIAQIFILTKTLSSYDPFEDQKQESFNQSLVPISSLSNHIVKLLNKSDDYSFIEKKNDFINLLKLNLWGNKCDLSLNVGASLAIQNNNPFEEILTFDENLLIDDSALLWNYFINVKQRNKNIIIDIVLDNAGYEFFTDLCIAAFLTRHHFAHKIRFYLKSFPWFVSDTTLRDFHWTIDELRNSRNNEMRIIGEISFNYLQSKKWTIEIESYWTEPFDYSEMKTKSLALYNKLSEASLIIFKGDLNYRKLLGDINWEYSTNFKTALREFEPTNLVALRTIKADLIVGLSPDMATALFRKQPDWMTTGEYGLIQALVKS